MDENYKTPIHVVYRKRPNKEPFQIATFATRMEADRYTESRPDCYVISYDTSTASERALIRPSVPWITLR